jgi:hypothetical protein
MFSLPHKLINLFRNLTAVAAGGLLFTGYPAAAADSSGPEEIIGAFLSFSGISESDLYENEGAVIEILQPMVIAGTNVISSNHNSGWLAAIQNPPRLTVSNGTFSVSASQTLQISHSDIVASSGAVDQDRDPLTFEIRVLSGTLSKPGGSATNFLRLAPGESLSWRGPTVGPAVFQWLSIRAHDGSSLSSEETTILARVLPWVLTAATNLNPQLGQQLRFTVDAIGPGPLQYLWFRNNLPVLDLLGPNAVIPSVSINDSGSYSVEVSNAAGTTRATIAQVTFGIPQRLDPPILGPGGKLVLRFTAPDGSSWNGAPLDQFRILVSTDLKTWQELPSSNLQVVEGKIQFEDATPLAARKFYQVLTR